jgi:signal transduction histidine kinase
VDDDKARAGTAARQRDIARRERDQARRERDDTASQLGAARAEVDILKAAEEVRELFIGVLAHDLTNPLTAILSTADLILRRGSLPDIEYKATARIASGAARALRMIDQLLDFTRSRLGGGLPIHRGAADLARICRQMLDEIQSAHPDRVLLLKATGNCSGTWDADRLAQLVGNLVSNAIDHGDADTPVRTRAIDEGDIVVLEVSNRGAPIPPELLPTVFEAFRRRTTGSKPSHGLGLGLFIAQQIAQAHSGTIEVESSAEDRTTTVTVRLPRSA